ncbi:hypothetical protein TTHERM_00784720 (macronuclear) [Tetrahymena thermophila SB210]|uniref:Cyclic nucleotide-binding domain protein n=1 Tax=Tetrahymena thermophila (strain SB210) TaxID=312017 RepID=Q231L7_TETTS|nr:hypothetical protein TTHERM_00784720 [Tetrahymena thermophila SB210]EAR91285.2 hypothetical protein TTHERM_00784720 [Tetrahymena thermophila SB210]|eukprot:XP_001011530.2 hypothetical protein TTHERM_00784720 [Tetrahymena thermophila SB210]
MANAQHFQELIQILQQDGTKRSVSELQKMIEICNKHLDFFQKYNLNALLEEDQILDFYRNLSLFKFKVPKKQTQKPKQLQGQGLLFLLEGELSRYIVNIRNENQQENEKNVNSEPLYSLQTFSPGEEIGQIMDFFKKSQAFRIEISCVRDCLFMQLNQGYFQQYLEQQLKQFNQSQVYFLRDITYFSHLTRDEIMLIYMTSKYQQNLKGDLVHNPQKQKSTQPGTIKIILEGEFLARCQVSLQSIDYLNSQKTDLSSLQKIVQKKNVYNSLFLQSPFDFFGLEYYNLNQSENISQDSYNYEIICHSQFAKILCIWPSIIQIINNSHFEKQMIQLKQNQMNLIKTKLSKILDLQNSITKNKKRQSKIEQKSLSSLEVPTDILGNSPQKSQNNTMLKNQTSAPSQIVLPAVFQDEIMLNALSSIKSIKDLSHNNNYIQAKRQSQNKDSNEILKNSNTIDVVSAFKQNRKNSLIYETESRKLNEQKQNLQLKNKHKNELNQKSVDYISYDQINKQIENLFNSEKQSEQINFIRNQKNQNNNNENQLEDRQNSLSLNKRNSQSYRKNTHFFIHHLKKTIDSGNVIPHQKQNLSINDLNQANHEDQFVNKNISFQYLLPHVDSIQNLTELSNNKSRDELKAKKKKSIYQYENQNTFLPKLNELKQSQNYYHANNSSKKEISKLYLQNLDLSSLNEDSQSYNIKQDKLNNSIIHQNDQIVKALRKKIEEESSLTQRKKVASCHENSQSLLQKQFQNKIYTRKKIIRPNQEDQSTDKKLSVDKSSRRELSVQENKAKKKEQQDNKRFYLQIDQSLRQKIEFDTIKNTLLKHTNNQSYTEIVSSKLESQKERSPQQSLQKSEKKNSLSKNLNKLIDQIHNSQNQKKITVNQSQKYYDGIQNNSIVLSKQIDLNLTSI